uniref:Uncharacterized protein n=1 Tax=Arundo donax TaxID=35708 RepID=A0A0A9BSK8_ARUDO
MFGSIMMIVGSFQSFTLARAQKIITN